ncbi:MAG: hypothetical protein ACU0BB_10725 [Paracoccaceae bacterium]
MRFFGATAIVLALAGGPAMADGLWDKVQKGVKKTGETIEGGAKAVGDTVSKGADVVGDTVDSTVDLVTNEETPAQTRAKLDAMANSVLSRLLDENQAAAEAFGVSEGYAIFDSRSITVFPVKAGYGRGVAINKLDGARTYMNMGTGGVGAAAGIGGFASQFVIFFETEGDFLSFVINGYDGTAEGGAKAGYDETQETARFVNGRTFFTLSKRGWRVNAAATSTKYWLAPDLN